MKPTEEYKETMKGIGVVTLWILGSPFILVGFCLWMALSTIWAILLLASLIASLIIYPLTLGHSLRIWHNVEYSTWKFTVWKGLGEEFKENGND